VAGSAPGDLQLVRADLPGAPGPKESSAGLRYEIVRGGLPTGQHVMLVLEGGQTSNDFAGLLELIDRKFDQKPDHERDHKFEYRTADHQGRERNPQPTAAP
jgi:hypothetical protein